MALQLDLLRHRPDADARETQVDRLATDINEVAPPCPGEALPSHVKAVADVP